MSKSRVFPGQMTADMNIVLSVDVKKHLSEVARTFGLTPAAYARSLIVTHLTKIAKKGDAK